MRNVLAKELKIKFVEILNDVASFKYETGNPFLITINNNKYFIFLKNLSPAYFKNSPDITRIQLPYSEHFKTISETDIVFLIFGYDADNDVLACWNPTKVKDRLNTKHNVSLYSRESLQASVSDTELKIGTLSTGEKFVIFKRNYLADFFLNIQTVFDDLSIVVYSETSGHDETANNSLPEKLSEITDVKLLELIDPLLKENKVLQCVEICSRFYVGKYKTMAFKDWFKLIKDIYEKSY